LESKKNLVYSGSQGRNRMVEMRKISRSGYALLRLTHPLLTVTRTWAPILKSFNRIVPQLAWATFVQRNSTLLNRLLAPTHEFDPAVHAVGSENDPGKIGGSS